MCMRTSLCGAAIWLLLLAGCGAAGGNLDGLGEMSSAITNGQPDESRHPWVGDVVYRPDLGSPWLVGCSASLVSPRVVITAAHCWPFYEGLGPQQVGVTFDAVIGSSPKVVLGRYVRHPDYTFDDWRQNDIAVVILDHPVTDIRPGRLAPVGLLDALDALGLVSGARFDTAGYGISSVTIDPTTGSFDWSTVGTRRVATSAGIALGSFNFVLDMSPPDNGGGCYRDSGGPHMPAGTDIIVANTQDGDFDCLVTDDTFRLDVPGVQAFLSRWMDVPERVPVCVDGRTHEVRPDDLGRWFAREGRLGACPRSER